MPEHPRHPRNGRTIREAAALTGLSTPTIKRWTSMSRADWLAQQAAEREAIRAYHDDEGHSWPQTAKHFQRDITAVRKRAYRARKDRARAAEEAAKGPQLPFDTD